MVRALIDWGKKKINAFLKDKGDVEASMEISGLDSEFIDDFHKDQLQRIAKEHLEKIGSVVPVQHFHLRIVPKKKGAHIVYSLKSHIETDAGKFASGNRGRDLIIVSNETLFELQRQVMKSVGRHRDLMKETARKMKGR